MSFCVECGVTGRTFKGLCPKCFDERRKLITPPEFLDLVKCGRCSRLMVGKSWVSDGLNEAIVKLLEQKVETPREVTFRNFSIDSRQEDERNFTLNVTVLLRVEDMEIEKDFITRLRIQGGVCPTCGKKAGFYYESILQVRADGRQLTEDEKRAILNYVQGSVGSDSARSKEFISKIEPVRGGFDFYLSSHDVGKNLTKSLRAKYGGTTGKSPRLYGLKDGREVYRTTHLVRLPKYRIGDVMSLDGDIFEVVRLGIRPLMRNMKTGERRQASSSEVKKAQILSSERMRVEVLAVTDKEVEYFDPVKVKPAKVKRSPNMELSKHVEIVRTDRGDFLSSIKTEDDGQDR